MAAGVIDRYSMWVPLAQQREREGVSLPSHRRRRRYGWGGVTPEIYFDKRIDNSRVVRVHDAQRSREISVFAASICVLFVMTMIYCWQHFSAIEYGYKIEAQRMQRDSLIEQNRALRLEQASLRDPERIDVLARRMGLQAPQAGQVMHMDPSGEPAGPVMAKVSEIAVLSASN